MTAEELCELDTWIAKRVMGWRVIKHNESYSDFVQEGGCIYGGIPEAFGKGITTKIWRPTVDNAAAMTVLEKCLKKHPRIELYFADGNYELKNANLSPGEIKSPSLPLTICLFAKKLFSQPQPHQPKQKHECPAQ